MDIRADYWKAISICKTDLSFQLATINKIKANKYFKQIKY